MPTDTTVQVARWRVVTPPAAPVVTATDAASFLRIVDVVTSELELMIAAATDYAQDMMETSLVEQTLAATFYNGETLDLPRGPVRQILSIEGAASSSTTDYTLQAIGHGLRVSLNETVAYPITVTYKAGYATASAVPAAIRIAIMQHAGTMYAYRESVNDKSPAVVPHAMGDFYRLKGRGIGIG